MKTKEIYTIRPLRFYRDFHAGSVVERADTAFGYYIIRTNYKNGFTWQLHISETHVSEYDECLTMRDARRAVRQHYESKLMPALRKAKP